MCSPPLILCKKTEFFQTYRSLVSRHNGQEHRRVHRNNYDCDADRDVCIYGARPS
jgi:hypothetical protein